MIPPSPFSFRFALRARLDRLLPSSQFLHQYPFLKGLIVDLAIAFFSLPCALVLRLGVDIAGYSVLLLALQSIAFSGVTAGVITMTGMSRGMWRYVSMADLFMMARTVVFSELLFLPYLWLSGQYAAFPLTALLIQGFVLGGGWVSMRLFVRQILNYRQRQTFQDNQGLPALVVGVGEQSEHFLRQLLVHRHPLYNVIGFLDKEERNVDRFMHGVPVLGALSHLPKVLQRLARKERLPKVIIVSHAHFTSSEIGLLAKEASEKGIKLVHMPSPAALTKPETPRMGNLDFSELLKRPARATDHKKILGLIQGKKVLITGAGGSIGSECAHQLGALLPDVLIVTDSNEYALFKTTSALKAAYPHLTCRSILLDVRQKAFVDDLFKQINPDFVFHAAALKHVPMVENQPVEGVLTNVLGTRYVADACIKYKVAAMVMVSTDKAIMPKSLMGMTKRMAELYCGALSASTDEDQTKFLSVRFGNVLGSSGSVLPLFKKQILEGGPVTVTHPDITRYFMTISEASQLIIYALYLKMNTLAPKGSVFMLDMGEPIAILEMAETLIRLYGFKPYQDIHIEFTGLRPGEKLHEDLLFQGETARKTEHPHIFLSTQPTKISHHIMKQVEALEHFAWKNNTQGCVSTLTELFSTEKRAAYN